MRDLLRISNPLVALGVAVGCNALFEVEEPVIVTPHVEGGAAGAGGASAKDDGGGGSHTESSSGAGGADEPREPESGGMGGDPGVPTAGRDGGSGGVAEPPAQGGRSQDMGGATGTGGTLGAGGEVAASGGSPESAGSAGAASGPSCAEDSARCLNANQLEVCEGGAIGTSFCPHGCVNDQCAACEVGTVECGQGNETVRVCEEHGQFGPVTTCVNKTCKPEVGCDGVCAPGQARCNTEDGDAETCTAGEWTLLDECMSQVQRCVSDGSEAFCEPNPVRALGPDAPLSGGSATSQTPNFLRLYRLPPSTDTAVVAEMGLIGDGTPSYAQMVLYEDDGSGYPGARRATTATIDVEAPGPNTKLASPLQVLVDPEKDYWIGVVFASDGSPQLHCRTNMDAPPGYERSLSFGTAFPDPFPAGAVSTFDRECNLFLKVRTLTP